MDSGEFSTGTMDMNSGLFAILLIAGIVCFVTGIGGSTLAFALMGVGGVGMLASAFGGRK